MEKPVFLNVPKDKMQSFFRFEVPFSSLCNVIDLNDVILSNPVNITYEDILNALQTMQMNHTGILTINEEWLNPLLSLGGQIGLNDLLGTEKMADVDFEHAYMLIPFTRESTLCYVFAALQSQSEMITNGQDEVQNIQEWIDMLENVLFNEKHPMDEWHLTDIQKMSFVINLYDQDMVDISDDQTKELFHLCLEEECSASVLMAWRVKAYCLFGGNSVYEADWGLCADILTSLCEEDGNAVDANMLGIILYRGLIEDEDPDYDNAYRYFTIGAFNGVYESMCYCADMLVNGQGTIVNLNAAARLVERAYAAGKEMLTNGNAVCSFAEAALRMGDYARYGIGVQADGMLAYSYYLEAFNAMSLRMQIDQKYGDSELYDHVKERVTECEKALGDKVTHRLYKTEKPFFIDRILRNGHELQMRMIEKNHHTYLVFDRVQNEQDGFILVTIEELSYSRLVRETSIRVNGIKKCSLRLNKTVKIDQVACDNENGETIFMYHGRTVGKISCRSFTYMDERRPDWRNEPLIHFAAVSFLRERKEYDFICDIGGLKKGDHVIVETRYGQEEAVFLRKYEARMSEMPLEADRYKRVLRKKDFQFYA